MGCCWSGKTPESLAMPTSGDRWWSQEDWLHLPSKFEFSGTSAYTPKTLQAGWLSGVPAWVKDAQQADNQQLSIDTFRALSSGLGKLAFAGDKMRRFHRSTDGLVHPLEYWSCWTSHNQGGLVDVVAYGVDPSYASAANVEGRWDWLPSWDPDSDAFSALEADNGSIPARTLQQKFEDQDPDYPFWLQKKYSQIFVDATSWGGEFGMDGFGMSGGAGLHIDFKIRRLANRSLFGNRPLFAVFIPQNIWLANLDSLGELDEIVIANAVESFTAVSPSSLDSVLTDATVKGYMNAFKPGSYGVPTLSINDEPVALNSSQNDNDRIKQAQKISQLLVFRPPQVWASPDGFIGAGYPDGYGGWQSSISQSLGIGDETNGETDN